MGYICPHKFWQANYGAQIRKIIAAGRHLDSVLDFGDQQVFRGATTYTAIHVFVQRNDGDVAISRIGRLIDGSVQCRLIDDEGGETTDVRRFRLQHPVDATPWFFHDVTQSRFLEHMEGQGERLCPGITKDVFQGVITGADDIFLASDITWSRDGKLCEFFAEAVDRRVTLEAEVVVPVVRRQGFAAFYSQPTHGLLLTYDRLDGSLMTLERLKKAYPRTLEYLESFRRQLREREGGKLSDQWWGLSRAQNIARWRASKILVPYMINELVAAHDAQGTYFVNVTTGGYGLSLDELSSEMTYYVVGLLNSKLLDYYLKSKSSHFHGGYFPANKQFIKNLPIKVPVTEPEKRLASGIARRVERIINIKEERLARAVPSEVEKLERQIEAYQEEINESVFELYGIHDLPQ